MKLRFSGGSRRIVGTVSPDTGRVRHRRLMANLRHMIMHAAKDAQHWKQPLPSHVTLTKSQVSVCFLLTGISSCLR